MSAIDLFILFLIFFNMLTLFYEINTISESKKWHNEKSVLY